jgi:hypothetical protein
MAGKLKAAMGPQPIAAPDETDTPAEHLEPVGDPNHGSERINAEEERGPGEYVGARIAALGAEVLRVERT